ncbi:MAG: RNA-binding domain-containing protein [Thermofilaceae archaeon]
MKPFISSLEIFTLCHATENSEKVKRSIMNLLPFSIKTLYESLIDVTLLEGHYGNPIFFLKLKIDNSVHATLIIKHLMKNLDPSDILNLETAIDLHQDSSGNLYLRFDKQQAYLGRVKLNKGDDVIKIKIRFKPFARQEFKSRGLRVFLE